MILDLIFLGLCAGSFAGGWWMRGRFSTAGAVIDAGAAKLKSVFGGSKPE